MTAYYNENDPVAAEWLRWLIAEGHLPPGHVDDRSIEDVQPDDIEGFAHVHLFAGIGGWGLAAQLAGWPDDRPLWTASCPCQPFSVAGKGAGQDDPRHLWPHVFRLASAARPPVLVGEQVAGKAGYDWFDGVAADLEGEGYACRAVDVPACAVDAPHIRQRLYWVAVADANGSGRAGRTETPERQAIKRIAVERANADDSKSMVYPARIGRGEGRAEPELWGGRTAVAGADAPGNLGDALGARLEGQRGNGDARAGPLAARPVAKADGCDMADADLVRGLQQERCQPNERGWIADRSGSFWTEHEWIICHDGKARRTQPGLPLLAHGVPGRVAAWRGLGNAIVPPLAAQVLRALL